MAKCIDCGAPDCWRAGKNYEMWCDGWEGKVVAKGVGMICLDCNHFKTFEDCPYDTNGECNNFSKWELVGKAIKTPISQTENSSQQFWDSDPMETTTQGGKQAKINEAFELIPPIPLMQIAGVFCAGRDKYGEGNWHNITAKNHVGRAIRHLYKWLSGDKEENHLANAVVRCLMAMELSREEKD